MKLTPEETAAIKEQAAEKVAERIYADMLSLYGGDLAELQLLPIAYAAALLGVPVAHVKRHLATVDTGRRPQKVSLADLREFIAARREAPNGH